MITVRKQPPVIAGVYNPVVFEMESNKAYVDFGTKADNLLAVSTYFTTGSVTMTFHGQSITLTAAATPNETGTQFRPYNISMGWTYAQYISNILLTDLLKNYYLTKYFDISVLSTLAFWPRLRLMAKEKGTAGKIILSANTTRLTVFYNNNATDENARDFFGIRIKTIIGNTLLNEDKVNAQLARADISEILKPELSSAFEYPEINAQNMIKRPNICKNYKVEYNESWENPLTIYQNYSIATRYALNGGIPKWKQNVFFKTYPSIHHWLTVTKSFLTFQPDNKITDTASIEKLYFLYLDTLVTNVVTLKVKCYFTDGTNQTVSKGTLSLNKYDCLEVECGYTKLGLANVNTGKTVKKYEVWLQIVNTIISEKRTYIMDYGYYRNVKRFIFSNSLGGFDTVRFTGVSSRKSQFERQVYENGALENYSQLFQARKQIISEEIEPETVNTGWLQSIEWVSYYNEMLRSDAVYQYTDMLEHILVTSTEVEKDNDDVKIYSLWLEYYKTSHPNAIQPLVTGIGNIVIGRDLVVSTRISGIIGIGVIGGGFRIP